MFSNKRAAYDLLCILAENRFCYLLQQEIYFGLYITCVMLQRVKRPLFANAWIDDL